jgi:hypothetical protein
MMDSNREVFYLGVILVLFFVGMTIGEMDHKKMKIQAIELGYAEYQDGEWQWKVKKDE